MSIRAKLILVFMLVVIFSGANLYVYYWGKNQTDSSLEELRKANETQVELGRIEREFSDIQKQIQILVTFNDNSGDIALSPEQIEDFDSKSQSISQRFEAVAELISDRNRAALEKVTAKSNELIRSWRRFYLFFGRQHMEAITELSVNGEPLSTEVTLLLLPELIAEERLRVDQARKDYYERTQLTSRITVLMFAGSTLVLLLALLVFSRDLVKRLAQLRRGAEQIGAGELSTRLEDNSRDELGDLAQSFNAMGGKLAAARAEIDEQYEKVESERARAEGLLLNILPESTAAELRTAGKVAPQYYSQGTVLFADIKGFTLATEKISVDKLVEILNAYFTAFDRICEKYGVEKLKTIGDCYMAVAGVPSRRLAHCVNAVLVGWEFIEVAKELSQRPGYPPWQVRVGIHTGPVIAGVVGINKFAFDIWGSTVNRAARLEQGGSPGRINISEDVRLHVKDFFELESRGQIVTKERQGVEMFFVTGPQRSLSEDGAPVRKAFQDRYNLYFQEELSDLPESLVAAAEQSELASQSG